MLPQLANTSSIQRFTSCDEEDSEHNLNNSLRCSVQRRDSNLLKSQFSIKSRDSQADRAPNQVPPHPYHPMSRYHGQSSIDGSSKHLIRGSPYQYHKEKSFYCPSEHDSRSNAYNTAEMTPKRILVSPRDQTILTPSRARLDRVSSRFKIQNQNMESTKDGSSDETTCSSELHRRVPDQRKRMGKFDKRTAHHNHLSSINRKKKSGDDLSVGSSSQSNSVASSATSINSSSSSRGSLSTLPTVPFQKPGSFPATTRSKKPLISQHGNNKSPRGSLSTLPIVPFQKPGNFPATTRSKTPLSSQHEHNKSLQRNKSTRQKFVSSRRNSRKLAKESDTPEQKKGRFKRLKDKLAIVFHHRHDHHHYHHNHASGDGSFKGRAARGDKDHHHRSLWKYLKGTLHHSSEQTTEIVPSQQHHHRHMRALFRMLFGHLWGNKRKKKTQLGRTSSRVCVKKLRWWQKFRRGGRMKLNNGRKARLKLRHGAR